MAEAATAAEQLDRYSHLHRLLPATELSAEALEPDGAVESAERDLELWVELVQVPTQPLLSAASFVDEAFPVVDDQLQFA